MDESFEIVTMRSVMLSLPEELRRELCPHQGGRRVQLHPLDRSKTIWWRCLVCDVVIPGNPADHDG